jgi:hypothetical protein
VDFDESVNLGGKLFEMRSVEQVLTEYLDAEAKLVLFPEKIKIQKRNLEVLLGESAAGGNVYSAAEAQQILIANSKLDALEAEMKRSYGIMQDLSIEIRNIITALRGGHVTVYYKNADLVPLGKTIVFTVGPNGVQHN